MIVSSPDFYGPRPSTARVRRPQRSEDLSSRDPAAWRLRVRVGSVTCDLRFVLYRDHDDRGVDDRLDRLQLQLRVRLAVQKRRPVPCASDVCPGERELTSLNLWHGGMALATRLSASEGVRRRGAVSIRSTL